LSEIGERDVPTDLGLAENLHVKGFLEDAFGTALAHDRPLLSRTRRTSTTLIADPHARDKTLLDPVFQAVGKLSGMVTGLFAPITDEHPEPAKVSWAEAVRVSIVQKQGETWAVLDPDIWIWPPRAREVATDFLDHLDHVQPLQTGVCWTEVLVGVRPNARNLAGSAIWVGLRWRHQAKLG